MSVAAASAVALAVSVVQVSAATAAPAGTITELSAGLPVGSAPEEIAPGPDGNLWFVDGGTTAVGRITPAGGVSEFSAGLGSGHDPNAIAPGPDGNVWFTDETSTGAIGQVTPGGTITEFSAGLKPGSAPSFIAPGPDGNLWFTDRGTTPAIGRITPSGTITEFSEGLSPGGFPIAIAPGPDGNLWFTDGGTTKAVGKITPSGTITEFTGLKAGSGPGTIAPGPDGNLWFTEVGSSIAIGRITPSGAITEFSTGLKPGSTPISIAPGADGNVWFTDRGTTPAIGRITSAGTITEFSAGLAAESAPASIAPGPDGGLWFTDLGTTKAIGQVATGAPEALAASPVVSGGAKAGAAQLCSASWSTWAGQQPSASLYGFDGYRWLLDGVQFATGQIYTPTSVNVGHQLSCAETVTYPLPFFVSTSAVSAPSTVVGASPLPVITCCAPAPLRITAAKQSHRVWREGRRLAHISRRPPVGTTFSFTLNQQARVSFAFTQQASGRVLGGRCVAQTKANRAHRSCRRSLTRGSLTIAGHLGSNGVAFQGRLSRSKKLALGTYTLVIVAANAAGRSSPSRLTFTIVK
ncbi:MAG TPA: hypothetical protein VGO14_02685 [Solirubrobacteraceae bacterium]|jgi:streptogramin lyase|nr:hypothetical protein [Solirubrobacteraceae bacterium]